MTEKKIIKALPSCHKLHVWLNVAHSSARVLFTVMVPLQAPMLGPLYQLFLSEDYVIREGCCRTILNFSTDKGEATGNV